MPKTVLFDFDGTLADTTPAIAEGVNLTMKKFGFPTHTVAAVQLFISHGARHLIRSAIPPERREDEALVDAALAEFNLAYRETHLQTRELYPGMREILERLRGTVRIGVLSNKPDEFLQNLVAQTLPHGCCDGAQGGLTGFPQKPDPYLPNLLTRRLGVSPSDCLLVGDSDVDVETARRCEMAHVGVTWGYRSADTLISHGATCTVDTAEELEKALREWIARP